MVDQKFSRSKRMSRPAISSIPIHALMLRDVANPQRAWEEQALQQSNPSIHPCEWKVWQVVLATLMIIAIESALAYGSAQLGSHFFEVDPFKCGVITGGIEVGLSGITCVLLVLCAEKDKRSVAPRTPLQPQSQREVRELSRRRPLESFEESASERSSEQKEESSSAPGNPRLGEDFQHLGRVIYSVEKLLVKQDRGLKIFSTKQQNISVSQAVDKNIQTFVMEYRKACYFFISDDNYCLYIKDPECPDRLETSKEIAIVNGRLEDLAKQGISDTFFPSQKFVR